MPKRVMMDNVITDEEGEEEEVEVEVEEKDDRKNNSKEKILKNKKAHPDCPAATRPSSSSPDSNPGKNDSGCGGVVVADAVVEQTVIETVIDIATDAIIDSAVDNAATSTSDTDSDSDDSLSALLPVRPTVVDNNEQEEKNVLADYDFSADREFWNGHRMTTISLDSTQGSSETLLREEGIDNNHETTTTTNLGCVQCCCIIPALLYFLSID